MWCLALQRVMCSLQAHQEVMSEGGEGLGVEKGGEEEGRRRREEGTIYGSVCLVHSIRRTHIHTYVNFITLRNVPSVIWDHYPAFHPQLHSPTPPPLPLLPCPSSPALLLLPLLPSPLWLSLCSQDQSSLSEQLLAAVEQGGLGGVLKVLYKRGVEVNKPNKVRGCMYVCLCV